MGYKYSFVDNEIYGTDDINAVISRLTTKGVAVCPEGRSVVDAMNQVVSELAEPGVEFDTGSLKVSADGDNIKIARGTAFFDDGVCFMVDDEGITLPMQKGTYVYLYRDGNRNSCYPCQEEELPQSGYVLLAQISGDGVVSDKREFAVSKLAPNSPATPKKYSVPECVWSSSTPHDRVLATVDAGYSDFGYLAFKKKIEYKHGNCKLIEGEWSEAMPVYRNSTVRFRKVGSTVELSVIPGGYGHTLSDMEIYLV